MNSARLDSIARTFDDINSNLVEIRKMVRQTRYWFVGSGIFTVLSVGGFAHYTTSSFCQKVDGYYENCRNLLEKIDARTDESLKRNDLHYEECRKLLEKIDRRMPQ